MASNEDLITFLIATAEGVKHYVKYGFAEGKKKIVLMSGVIWHPMEFNTAFNKDTVAGTKHYISNGFYEGKQRQF